MYKVTKLFIFFNIITFITTSYLKKNVDKSNVVNKGVWFKKKVYKDSNFIFPTSSDLDSVLQNNFDAFKENNVPSPFSSNYIDRSKRSPNYKSKSSKSRDECKDKPKCQKQNSSSQINSKFISTLKPASVFNDYPFEIAVLLSHNNDESLNSERNSINIPEKDVNSVKMKEKTDEATANIKDIKKDILMNLGLENDLKIKSNHLPLNLPPNTKDDITNVNKSVIMPKRSMNQQDYENELIKKIEFVEEFNNTESYKSKKDRNIFEKEAVAWHRQVPPSNANIYKVIPKSKEDVKKRINERGLIKVLSMLTKTFKKIMKQHSDIKQIHNKLYNLNDDFIKNVDLLTKKFEDFNVRYSEIMKVSQNLQRMEVKLRDKELNYNKREKEFSKKLTEFENQQKKFLAQQRQFYNVQKILLQQNEQINIKQNLITKTHSEISHRQNNFAKILKKAKQFYMDSKHLGTSNSIQPVINTKVVPTSFTTESVKINLFSVPTVSQLKDQDQLIMGEKDSQPVDDLIYKYYFNNTFMDDIMKNKILPSFIASESIYNNKTKNKRNLNTTILLPVHKRKSKIRNRRWIIHSKKKHIKESRRNETKIATLSSKIKDNIANNNSKDSKLNKNDPFKNMALNFCKEIGQNVNTQILNWCIEKILRRLKVIDLKRPPPIQIKDVNQGLVKSTVTNQSFVLTTSNTLNKKIDTATSSAITKPTTFNVFFPDNDDLENKLKEYELTPDPEGTVYYDGSLHSSDLGHIFNVDSEGFSDIMPGLESDSRVQVDPFAIDLQEQRRAEVRKINARIMKMKM